MQQRVSTKTLSRWRFFRDRDVYLETVVFSSKAEARLPRIRDPRNDLVISINRLVKSHIKTHLKITRACIFRERSISAKLHYVIKLPLRRTRFIARYLTRSINRATPSSAMILAEIFSRARENALRQIASMTMIAPISIPFCVILCLIRSHGESTRFPERT